MNAMLLLALTHWAVDPMSTVQRLPDAEPKDGEKGGVVSIVAAKGEYEPGSFVLRPDADIKKAVLEVGEFKTEDGKSFPRKNLDLKVVKVWVQNENAWYSYFGDCGKKLVPELLLNDENLIRVDEMNLDNYARLTEADGRVHERWLTAPRQLDRFTQKQNWRSSETFLCMRPNFKDAETLQPVRLEKGRHKQFFLTAHVTPDVPSGTYRGEVKVKGEGEQWKIPVSLRVLDFELPEPRAYADPARLFKVSSYSYMDYNNIFYRNGYDLVGAKRLFGPIFRNLVAHNQNMYILPCGFNEELEFTLSEMKKAGMCTDELMGVVHGGKTNDMEYVAGMCDCVVGHRNIHISYGDEPGPGWMIPARHALNVWRDWGFSTYIAGGDMVFHKAGYLYDWFNMARQPTDDAMAKMWDAADAESVAWYANQHVGAEDPSFNRRQNGLGAWLAGYTSLCNYAHHFGNWNDDSTTYRPMVFAYGTGSGVVDTLQWEGFREGVDDIRYGTAMMALAREAAQSSDRRTVDLGRQALSFFAEFDRTSDSLTWARAEMIRYILALREKLGHDAVIAARRVRKPNCPKVDLEPRIRAELAACRKPEDLAKVYNRYAMRDKAYEVLVASNRQEAAATQALANGRPDLAYGHWIAALDDPKTSAHERSVCFAELLAADREAALRRLPAAFGKTKASTNELLHVLFNWHFKCGRYYYDSRFAEGLDAFRILRTGWAAAKKPVPFKAWSQAVQCAFALGDGKQAATLADEALASADASSFKPEESCQLRFASLVGSGKNLAVADADRTLDPKKRTAALETIGCAVMRSGDERTVRKIAAFRKTLLVNSPKRRYTVRYSERLLEESAAWAALSPEAQPMDRRYGGSTDVLYTDVASDRGQASAQEWKRSEEKGKSLPTIAVAADAWGLHFRYDVADTNAAAIAAGLVGGDSWEGYVAPAGKAYTGLFLNVGRDTKLNLYGTSYDNLEHRNGWTAKRPEWSRVRTVFGKDRVTTYVSLAWDMFALTLPKDGDVWDYENMRWAKKGDNAWNGTDSIHGRSTWGELVFELPESARREIVRRQVVAAKNFYEQQKNPRINGILEFWNDPLQGDPAFYAACVKPLVERLDAYLPVVTVSMSDADVDRVAVEAMSDWLNIRHLVEAARADYLTRLAVR